MVALGIQAVAEEVVKWQTGGEPVIAECPGCSKVIEVRCGKCGGENVIREPGCAMVDALVGTLLKEAIPVETTVWICFSCGHVFNAGEGGHESRWCSACLDRMVISDREFTTGERDAE